MTFKKLLTMAAAVMMAGSMWAQPADGEYYLYNLGAKAFLVGANNWGTRASLSKTGGLITTVKAVGDGAYTISTAPTYSGKYLGSDGYVDNGTAGNWVLAAVEGESGVYTMSIGEKYIYGADGVSYTRVGTDDKSSDYAKWQFISKADRVAGLAAATASSPLDATFLLVNPNFGRNSSLSSGWTGSASMGGANENFCVERYHTVFQLEQALTDVPNGTYAMTVQGFYRQDGSDNDNLPVFYANSETKTFPLRTGSENSMSDASGTFTNGGYTIDPILVTVTDGKLTVGAKLETNTNLWCIWDNFQLTYYGNVSLEDVQLAELNSKLAEVVATAKAVDQTKAMDPTVLSALQAAITAQDGASYTTTAEYETAIAAVETATSDANKSIAIHKAWADLVAEYNSLKDAKKSTAATTAYGKITVVEPADESDAAYTTAYNTLNENADLVFVRKSVFSYQIVEAGVVPDNDLKGWVCENTNTFHINTWSGEGDSDGSNMKTPFIENWVGRGSFLGAGKVYYKLEGLEPGEVYYAQALVRSYNEASSDAPNGPNFFINDTDVDMTTEGTTFTYNNMSGIYATLGGAATIGEDGTLTLGVKINDDVNYNWVAFKSVSIRALSALIEAYDAAIADAQAVDQTAPMYKEALAALQDAISKYSTVDKTSVEALGEATTALTSATNDAKASVAAYAGVEGYLEKMKGVLDNTNVYTAEAYDTWYANVPAKYAAGEYTNSEAAEFTVNGAYSNGWHSANKIDDILLSAWTVGGEQAKDYSKGLYINTWSVEGNNDGTNFKVPFFEYWTADGNSLDATTLEATVTDLPAGDYEVTAWVRVRAKNGVDAADATGITLKANDSETIDVTEGEKVGTSQFNIGKYSAIATVAADGKLTITIEVAAAADNNISWLSYKDVKYTKVTEATLAVSETAGYATFVAPFDVEIPEGVTASKATGVDEESNLVLEAVEGTIPANTPVILESATEVSVKVYGEAVEGTPKAGLLTGVYEDTPAPAGSYVLQSQTDGVKFYLVGATVPTVKAGHAYLTIEGAGVKAIGFGGATAIKNLTPAISEGEGVIYNLAGQRVNTLQKGINIVGGKKVLVK